jgi:hypothetical protein
MGETQHQLSLTRAASTEGCRAVADPAGYHLYEDAFLCARHSGILGADDELYILEHWGSRDFEQ